jgi:hypothetical protein
MKENNLERQVLNKIENEKERELCYKELCLEILADLKKGWNPTCLTKFSRICISLRKVCFRKEKKTIYHINLWRL